MGRGLFVVGTDTGVGKTYVAAIIARQLNQAGQRVGVYKPAASGCEIRDGQCFSADAHALWVAAGEPATLHDVCPQCFEAPIAPHLAARREQRTWDTDLLRTGALFWRDRSDVVVVEGVGGLLTPLGDEEYVADLATDLAYRLIVVAPNRLGVINQTLQTLIAAFTYGPGLEVAGIVLNNLTPDDGSDLSRPTNAVELQSRCVPPLLAQVDFEATEFSTPVDWWQLASESEPPIGE